MYSTEIPVNASKQLYLGLQFVTVSSLSSHKKPLLTWNRPRKISTSFTIDSHPVTSASPLQINPAYSIPV
jgi:hypothetical protein